MPVPINTHSRDTINWHHLSKCYSDQSLAVSHGEFGWLDGLLTGDGDIKDPPRPTSDPIRAGQLIALLHNEVFQVQSQLHHLFHTQPTDGDLWRVAQNLEPDSWLSTYRTGLLQNDRQSLGEISHSVCAVVRDELEYLNTLIKTIVEGHQGFLTITSCSECSDQMT